MARLPVQAKTLPVATLSPVSEPGVKSRRPSHRVACSMGLAGASRESPNDALWETPSQRVSRLISTPLLTVVLPWR